MGMLDANTDRSYFMIGAIIIAGLIFGFTVSWAGSKQTGVVDNAENTLTESADDVVAGTDDALRDAGVILSDYTLTVRFINKATGSVIRSESGQAVTEGKSYTYTPRSSLDEGSASFLAINTDPLTGVMPQSDHTIDVEYNPNGLVEIYYVDAAGNRIKAQPEYSQRVPYGSSYSFATAKSFSSGGKVYRRLVYQPSIVNGTGSTSGQPNIKSVAYEEAVIESLTKSFPLSKNVSQTHTITIPDLMSVESVSVDDGSVTYSVTGNTIVLRLSGSGIDGSVHNATKYSKNVTKTETSSSRSSLGSSTSYSDADGYSGAIPATSTITSYSVASGGYWRDVYETRTRTVRERYAVNIPWCYSPTTGASHGNLPCEYAAHQTTRQVFRWRDAEETYTVRVGQQWVTTYSTHYRRTYGGTVYKSGYDNTYGYDVTISHRTY